MLELALVLFTAAPDFLQVHAAHIKEAAPLFKGDSRSWAITGKQSVLGEPSRTLNTVFFGHPFMSFMSAHRDYCYCAYDKLGICVVLCGENQWAVDYIALKSMPENWVLQNVWSYQHLTAHQANNLIDARAAIWLTADR
jgi:hypothetical protein